MKFHPGETEQFFVDPDLVLTEAQIRHSAPLVEWWVAEWREARFGVPPNATMLSAAIDRALFSGYVLCGDRPGLPSGAERSWARGIWVPVTWGRP